MGNPAKIVIISQHYPPDPTTTAAIMAEIAGHLGIEHEVFVISGTPGSGAAAAPSHRVTVVEIRNRIPAKAALLRRAASEMSFAIRGFGMLLRILHRGDVVLTVTAPFMLPYAVTMAAWLKCARSALVMHDLYPDVLVMAGVLKPASPVTRVIRTANALMFRKLNAVVTIGRDSERLLLRDGSLTRDKIRFIPNWATLVPAVRPIEADNPYRRPMDSRFVAGLSGNLGFTHDPVVVFEAARLLRDDPEIHFLLSGWGIGFDRLKQLQLDARLPNVTLIERVPDDFLEQFLAAADVWLIPYRRHVAGVSVPSRFYNLLAVGRPVIMVSDSDAEAALMVTERRLGWVVTPDRPDELARAIKTASVSVDAPMAERAVAAAKDFNLERAMTAYANLIDALLRDSKPEGPP